MISIGVLRNIKSIFLKIRSRSRLIVTKQFLIKVDKHRCTNAICFGMGQYGSEISWQMIYNKHLFLDKNVNIFKILCGFLFL